MDIFGDHWEDHFGRISEDWRARVTRRSTVLIPGTFLGHAVGGGEA